MTYKIAITLLLAAALAACSGAETTVKNAQTQTVDTMSDAAQAVATKTKAVLIYADWCGSCKVLDPKIKAAKALGNIPGLEFVVLDYTDKNADAFYAAAAAADVEDAVRAHMDGAIKTGQLLLIDVDDKKVLTKITKTFEAPQILAAMKDAVAQS